MNLDQPVTVEGTNYIASKLGVHTYATTMLDQIGELKSGFAWWCLPS